mgnify:CR=1
MRASGLSTNSQTSTLIPQDIELSIGVLFRASRALGIECRSVPIILRLDLGRFHGFHLTSEPTDLMLQEVNPFLQAQINPTCRTANQNYC